MRTVFITQNELGYACLDELVTQDADLQRVYTKPQDDDISDQVTFESFTETHDIELRHVQSVNDPDVVTEIRECDPEVLFVIGWSQLVPPEILEIPTVAAVGMHPSPLPRGRGRAPIAWSLIKGLDETALSFFHLVDEADAGDLVGQEPISIEKTDDAADLYEKVVSTGRVLIREYYPKFVDGQVPRTPQDHGKATWWPKRTPDHGLIDWTQSPQTVYDWIRGQTHPYPGAYSYLDTQRVTIWSAEPPTDERSSEPPGTIVERRGEKLAVAAWEGVIEIGTIQVDETEAAAATLLTDHGATAGDRFANARDVAVPE